jgi:signal transduction histidine kinase
MIRVPRSLRFRMVALFGLVVVGIAGFMVAFFPAQIEDQLRASLQRRAVTLTEVLANAVAPAVDFNDAEYAHTTLGWLESSPDARFAIVTSNGVTASAWHVERAPDLPRVSDRLRVEFSNDLLVVTAPIATHTGEVAAVQVGFSLATLNTQRDRARTTVAIASLAVLGVGAVVCFVLATILVRPIRNLTRTARRIASGDAPPSIPAPAGADEVSQMATALSVMLDRLNEVNSQLIHASRHAGMAEVATGVLHNVGNVLTSVNVAVDLLGEKLAGTSIDRAAVSSSMLAEARASGDPARIDAAVRYTGALTARIARDHAAARDELAVLRRHVDHAVQVVLTQNRYAKTVTVVETIALSALIDEAIALGCPEAERKGITIARDVDAGATIEVDRHAVLQILVNLISNARDAVLPVEGRPRTITISAEIVDATIRIAVSDSGVGFGIQDRERIFQAGFTTKPRGHGYGLHSSAIAAQRMGGTVRCASAGIGQGATFTVRIPTIPESKERTS